jgi:hypothetical protein
MGYTKPFLRSMKMRAQIKAQRVETLPANHKWTIHELVTDRVQAR